MQLEAVRRQVELPQRGVTLATLDFGGDGPLALLAHANGFCAGLYGLVAPALRKEFRVVAFDWRGQGDSSKPPLGAYEWSELEQDLVALAERVCADLGRSRVEYGIGHSFGGTLTLAAAAARPDLFGRLALIDPVVTPPASEDPGQMERRRNFMGDAARKRRQVWPSRAELLEGWRSRETFADWDPRALELYAEEGFRDREDGQIELKCPGEIEAAIFELSGAFDILARAKDVQAPGLLLHASIDGPMSREMHQRLADSTPNLELEPVSAGHLMPMTAPEEVARRLLAFAARTPLAP